MDFNEFLIQQKACLMNDQVNEIKIQIVFCNNQKHKIVATTVDYNNQEVKVYDSNEPLYNREY